MTAPIKTKGKRIVDASSNTTVIGDRASKSPAIEFGGCRAYADGNRSALTVLGGYLVRNGIISPAAH